MFSAAVTLALPIGTVAALSAGSVGATTTKTITCTKVTGNINRMIEIKGCNGNTGTKSKKVVAITIATGRTVNWKSGKSTTFGSPILGAGTRCPRGDSDDTFIGGVRADTSRSVKPIPGTYQGEVCINNSNGAISLAPGTTVTVN